LAQKPADADGDAKQGKPPDGITRRHLEASGGLLRGFLPLGILGALLLAALLGLFGGTPDPTVSSRGNQVLLTVEAPRTLRGGMILEIDIGVATGRAIAKPVVAISGSYLRELSFNSTIPEPSQAEFTNGMVMLQYDALQAGDRLQVKMDGQVNPTLIGVNEGAVELRDDKTVLVRRPVRLRVFP
jgi:hypothetical protein